MIFQRLRSLFPTASAPAPQPSDPDGCKQAAAVLLVLAARYDGRFDDSERKAISGILIRRFGMSEADAEILLSASDREAAQATDLYQTTRELKNQLDLDERIAIVEMLWQVIYADGRVDDMEANLARRVAGLLCVPDRDSAEARQRMLADKPTKP
jgi:uncharacterized tellurite resistance protein B-like protein